MSRKLVVAYNGADAGLGNRMRVTLGAANLAAAEGRDFRYVWPQGPAFRPAISDLWEWRDGRRMSRVRSRLLARSTGYLDNQLTDVARLRDRRIWQIRTGGVLQLPEGVESWISTFRRLEPIAEIQRTVRETFDAHLAGTPYLGVQVRLHSVSHSVTKDASPLEWYTSRLDEIYAANPDTRIFLSCDVPEIKRDLLARYRNAVGIEHDAPYNSTRAVQQAVADLYLLASSVHMLGPHFSSFIEMAQHLSHEQVTTEKASEDEPVREWSDVPLVRDPLRPADRGGSAETPTEASGTRGDRDAAAG